MAPSLDSFQTHFLIPPRFPETTSQVNCWHSDPHLQSALTELKPGQKYIHTANLPHVYLSRASLVTQMMRNLPASARDLGSIPESGRSPGGGNGNPLQYSCLESPMGRGAWRATVHGVTQSPWLTHTKTHTDKLTPVLRLVMWEKAKPNRIPAFSVVTWVLMLSPTY